MKKIFEFFKFIPYEGILINIIGLLMIAIGLSMIYCHAILNEFLLIIISLPLVYYGSILLYRDVYHITDTEKAMLAISYFTAYYNYRKTGIKQEIVPFTFEEANKELKEIRKRVDEVLSENKNENV